MSACEKCWSDSGGSHIEYMKLLEKRHTRQCTPKEQAGDYWDEGRQCDRRYERVQPGQKHD